MYDIPTDGCNMEIMGYPFYAESISVNEAFRRREYNFNGIVGGTQKVTKGAYVGLDFSAVTHVRIDPDRPDEHNTIFQEMMSKPVEVLSPEFGGRFNAIVVVTPEREKLDHLKLTFSIKEVPDSVSLIPGETFTVPASREVTNDKGKDKDKDSKDGKTDTKKGTTTGKTTTTKNGISVKNISDFQKLFNKLKSKSKTVPRKTKSEDTKKGK